MSRRLGTIRSDNIAQNKITKKNTEQKGTVRKETLKLFQVLKSNEIGGNISQAASTADRSGPVVFSFLVGFSRFHSKTPWAPFNIDASMATILNSHTKIYHLYNNLVLQ